MMRPSAIRWKPLGGSVEIGCYLPPRVLLVYREDGKQCGLPPNRWNPATNEHIFGTFLLCGLEEDAFESLTPAQRAAFQRYFAQSDSPPARAHVRRLRLPFSCWLFSFAYSKNCRETTKPRDNIKP